jgi:hypothetical protein
LREWEERKKKMERDYGLGRVSESGLLEMMKVSLNGRRGGGRRKTPG